MDNEWRCMSNWTWGFYGIFSMSCCFSGVYKLGIFFQTTFFLLVHVRQTTTSRIDMVMIQFGTCISLEISSLELYNISHPKALVKMLFLFPSWDICFFSPEGSKLVQHFRLAVETEAEDTEIPVAGASIQIGREKNVGRWAGKQRIPSHKSWVQWKMDVSPRWSFPFN